MKVFHQDPNDRLDYLMDWAAEMARITDTISASEWTVPAPLSSDEDSFDNTSATVWLLDGAAGATYIVSNKVTTVGGRVIERSFKVHVLEL